MIKLLGKVGLIFCIFLVIFSLTLSGFQNAIHFDKEAYILLRIIANCEYSILLKEPQKEIKLFVQQMGDGFFVGEHKDGANEFVVTAAHILWCNATVGDLDKSDVFKSYDEKMPEDVSVQNIIAIKSSKLSRIFSFTADDKTLFNVEEIFSSSVANSLADHDKSLLKVSLSDNVLHEHLPLMDDKIFEEVIQKNGIKKQVYIRSLLYYRGGYLLRFKDAEIEWASENTFQINELLDRGISGSPIIYIHENTPYAIGVVSRSPLEETGRAFDWSWATTLKKSFLNSKKEKKD